MKNPLKPTTWVSCAIKSFSSWYFDMLILLSKEVRCTIVFSKSLALMWHVDCTHVILYSPSHRFTNLYLRLCFMSELLSQCKSLGFFIEYRSHQCYSICNQYHSIQNRLPFTSIWVLWYLEKNKRHLLRSERDKHCWLCCSLAILPLSESVVLCCKL